MQRKYQIRELRGRYWLMRFQNGIWLHIAVYATIQQASNALDKLREIHGGENW